MLCLIGVYTVRTRVEFKLRPTMMFPMNWAENVVNKSFTWKPFLIKRCLLSLSEPWNPILFVLGCHTIKSNPDTAVPDPFPSSHWDRNANDHSIPPSPLSPMPTGKPSVSQRTLQTPLRSLQRLILIFKPPPPPPPPWPEYLQAGVLSEMGFTDPSPHGCRSTEGRLQKPLNSGMSR